MKLIAIIMLALSIGLPMAAQKVRLDNQVQGQLSRQNATDILNAAADRSGGVGVHRGLHAHNGFVEEFTPDLFCSGTSIPGFQVLSNTACNNGYLHYVTQGAFYGFRNTRLGGAGVYPFPPNAFTFSFTGVFGTNPTGQFVGFNACNTSDWACANSGASDMGAYMDSTGIGLSWGGVHQLLFPVGGLSTMKVGNSTQDDNFGWAPFGSGSIYHVNVEHPGDGTVIVSVTPDDGSGQLCFLTTKTCAAAVSRVKIADPAGTIHQFGFRGSQANDFISNMGYAATPTYNNTPMFDVVLHGSAPWLYMASLHADGTEFDYSSQTCADCQDVFVWVPPNYNPDIPNPVVLHIKGVEDTVLSALSTFDSTSSSDKVLDALLRNGYVVVSIGLHMKTNYGDPQAIADVAYAWAHVRDHFALADKPYVMADSGGGVTTLNAITHGAIKPKAVMMYSPNTNLACDAQVNLPTPCTYANGTQMPFIETAYGMTDPSQYASVTAGYDPDDVMANPLVDRAVTGGTFGLLPHAASVLASIPMRLKAGTADTIVFEGPNSIQFVNEMNQVNPGIATCDCASAAVHVDPALFVGSDIIQFFSTH